MFYELVFCFAGISKRVPVHEIYIAMLQIQANGIAIVNSEYSSINDRRGSALYPKTSMFNHACKANAAISFKGRQVMISSTSEIIPGVEVNVCYGPQASFFHKIWKCLLHIFLVHVCPSLH